jgi:Holliday junction resolvasome RuvABC endonuclease subunit
MSDLIRNMLDNIIDDKQGEAQSDFNDAVAVKITDALEQRKQELAQQLGADRGEVQAD